MFLRLIAMAVLLGGVAVGCSGPRYVSLDAETPDAAAPIGTLSLLSPASLMLRPGQTATIDVRFLDGSGAPRAGVAIAAAIEGTALDSTLGSLGATTDASGTAHASVVAGTSASTFRVRLSAREASAPVFVDVGVGASFGSLLVHAPYTGTRPVTSRTIDVVPGTSCATLVAMPPESGGRTTFSPTDDVTIGALPTSLAYAVLVRASGDLAVEADGCVEGVMLTPDTSTRVDVTLAEVPLGLEGGYDVDLTLSASGAIEARMQEWASTLRGVVGDRGGDATILLDSIEAELVRAGHATDAADLHTLRVAGSLDAALATQLAADGAAPTEEMASLVDEAGTALDAPTVRLSLQVGTMRNGSMTTVSVATSDGRGGVVSLVPLAAMPRPIMPALHLDASFTFAGPVDTRPGALGLAWIDAVAAARTHGTGLTDVIGAACDSLETFAAGDGATALVACDGACRASACTAALAELSAMLVATSVTVDQDIDHLALAATVTARDADGDALVDHLEGTLRGQLVKADGSLLGSVDAVSGTLTGSRAPVP